MEAEEEVPGTPSFEVLVKDGEPIVSGSYFMAPPLYMRQAHWDPEREERLLVVASDGSRWYADGIAREGRVNVVLRRWRERGARRGRPRPHRGRGRGPCGPTLPAASALRLM